MPQHPGTILGAPTAQECGTRANHQEEGKRGTIGGDREKIKDWENSLTITIGIDSI